MDKRQTNYMTTQHLSYRNGKFNGKSRNFNMKNIRIIVLCISPCILSLCLPLSTHTIIRHSFADVLQLQMFAPLIKYKELLHSMPSCISDVKAWAIANMLRLNDNKTELMHVTPKSTKHLYALPTSITIGNKINKKYML